MTSPPSSQWVSIPVPGCLSDPSTATALPLLSALPHLDHSFMAGILSPSSLFSTLELDWSVTIQNVITSFLCSNPFGVFPMLTRQSPNSDWVKGEAWGTFLLGAALVKAVILNPEIYSPPPSNFNADPFWKFIPGDSSLSGQMPT